MGLDKVRCLSYDGALMSFFNVTFDHFSDSVAIQEYSTLTCTARSWILQRRNSRRVWNVLECSRMLLIEGFEEKIELLESNLSADDIIFFRTLTEVQIATEKKAEADKKRKKDDAKSSGGWFSSKKKKSKDEEEEDENDKKQAAIDDESKKELFALIDYDPNAHSAKAMYPPDYVVTRVKFGLGRCSLMFAEVNPSRDKTQHILHTSLENVKYVYATYYSSPSVWMHC